MDLTVNISKKTATIVISGMIDTLNSEKLLSELEALAENVCDIEFDLGQVAYISSSGLRVLLSAHKMADNRGGKVRVVDSSDFVREILATVGFSTLFEVI